MGLSETIDIPESGAVFTLGKSYLSENHQSYFFIKNDAIRRLICGRNQSAVVCESGRLFVWGENQFGQLGIGATDIVTKPSCVKTIKALGERVRNVAFGEAFAVILTETSKLFYSGRNVFEGANAAVSERFGNEITAGSGSDRVAAIAADAVLVCRKPFELTDFSAVLLDAEQNVNEHFVDVAAGDEHFVVLTGAGKMFGWGSNAYSQLGGTGGRARPSLLSGTEPVRVVSCGRKCTAFITAHNTVYILGTSGELQFVSLVSINTSSFEDLMYSIYFSHDDDQIYLVISSGEIFRSAEREGQLHFEPHNVISENIRKICTGAGFVAIVTESNKLLTTFRERSSAHDETGRLRSPRELRKFQKLEVVDAVCGEHHILVHGVQPSALNAVLSSSSNDEADTTSVMNDLNRTYTKSTSLDKDDGGDSLIQTLKRCLTMKDSRNILSSKIPVFDSRRLSQETMPSSLTNSVDADGESDSTMLGGERERHPIEKSTSLNEFEKLEQDEELIENQKFDDESKPNNTNGNASKIASPTPTSAGSAKSLAQTVIHRTPANQKLEDFNNNDGRDQQLQQRHSREDNASVEDELRELSMQNEMLGLEDEQPPDGMNSRQSNEIMFIDNGVEKHMSPSTIGTEESGEVADGVVAFTENASVGTNDEEFENTLLGEKLSGVRKSESIADIKEETMNAVRQAVGENDADSASASHKNTPKTKKAGDEGSDRTTASIASDASAKNPFESGDDLETVDLDINGQSDGLVAVENGRVKRFIREMRSKGRGMSCRNADTVVEETVVTKPVDEETVVVEQKSDEKTSKVCVIL